MGRSHASDKRMFMRTRRAGGANEFYEDLVLREKIIRASGAALPSPRAAKRGGEPHAVPGR